MVNNPQSIYYDALQKFQVLTSNTATYHDFLAFITITEGKEFEILPLVANYLLTLCQRVEIPFDAIDICGTGGDLSIKTTNISTISAFVLACMGIPVAKHGGRAVSSNSGSTDFLEALQIAEIPPTQSLQAYNLCFLKAQNYHTAFKHIAPFRKKYGKKTIFNMLGPLINPVTISHQMVGVSFAEIQPYAKALQELGRKNFGVVRSKSGGDELLSFEENTAIVANTQLEISPKKLGLSGVVDASITGTTPQENAKNALHFFENPTQNALCETVALNCGMASFIFGKTNNITDGISHSMNVIFSRKPADLLHSMKIKS